MYPRGAASPPRLAIGAVVQISDGAVQVSGCSVAVRLPGNSEAAGSGTLEFGGSGTAYYTPIQSETNGDVFCIVVYKSGCIPACLNVPTAADAAGNVPTDVKKWNGSTPPTAWAISSGDVLYVIAGS